MNKYQKKIIQLEKEKKFNEHIKEVDFKKVKTLDKNFKYLPKSIFFKGYSFFLRALLGLLTPIVNFVYNGIKIEGRQKIRKVKKAIAISNHVLILDSLIVRQALSKSKLYITSASFNNKKGLAGLTLRAGGLLPLGECVSTQKKFNEAMKILLSRNNYVLFYPEVALWPNYEKPRPGKRGAFYFAYKNNVPIIPLFICFREAKGLRKKLINKRSVTVKILDLVYPDASLTERESIEKMKQTAEESYKKAYEDFYKKPLTFDCFKEELPDIIENK